jgi:hypothetical protein
MSSAMQKCFSNGLESVGEYMSESLGEIRGHGGQRYVEMTQLP